MVEIASAVSEQHDHRRHARVHACMQKSTRRAPLTRWGCSGRVVVIPRVTRCGPMMTDDDASDNGYDSVAMVVVVKALEDKDSVLYSLRDCVRRGLQLELTGILCMQVRCLLLLLQWCECGDGRIRYCCDCPAAAAAMLQCCDATLCPSLGDTRWVTHATPTGEAVRPRADPVLRQARDGGCGDPERQSGRRTGARGNGARFFAQQVVALWGVYLEQQNG
jgi:hypothetical protein